MNRNSSHAENIEECEKIFVGWNWFVGAVSGSFVLLVITLASMVYSYAKAEQLQDSQLSIYKDKLDKIDKIEQEINDIKIDLDTMRINIGRK